MTKDKVEVTTITVSEIGLALILLDQELRNNQEQKRRINSRLQRLQQEMDEISLESLRCQQRIDANQQAISRLVNTHDYDVIYSPLKHGVVDIKGKAQPHRRYHD